MYELTYSDCKNINQDDFVNFCKYNLVNIKKYDLDYFDEIDLLAPISLSPDKTKKYYSYWQLYLIDSINDFRTKHCEICFSKKNNTYYLNSNFKISEPLTQSKKLDISSFFKVELYYNCLCDFIQFYHMAFEDVFHGKPVGYVLEDSESEYLDKKLETISKELIDFYDFNKEDLYEFLRELCRQYFVYDKKSKNKLLDLIKSDIHLCMKLIFYFSGDSLDKITSEVDANGLLTNKFRPYTLEQNSTLNVIFPDEREIIENKAMLRISLHLKHYNQHLHTKYKCLDSDVHDFIKFLEDNSLDSFLIFVFDVNRDYFEYNYCSNKSLVSSIRNLSVFLEEFTGCIGINSIVSDQYPPNKNSLKFLFNPLCKSESWWNMGYFPIEKIDCHNFHDKMDAVIQNIENTANSKNYNLDNEEKFVLINLRKANIIRNYFAHNSALIPEFRKIYPMLFQSLFNSVIIIWIIGKEKLNTKLKDK
ncbi:MAG: hypothetical protein R2741_06050 [Methanolobus sp.]